MKVLKVIFAYLFIAASLSIIKFNLLFPTADAASKKTKTEFFTDYNPQNPQADFYLGVRFKIEPKWHIYWQYPGEFGLPTRIEFAVPDGYEVQELQWPAPERFMQSAEQTGYGYSNEVVLFSKVKVAESAKNLTAGDLKATVKWLNCSESLCIPDSAEHVIKDFSNSAGNVSVFKGWNQKVPLSHLAAGDKLKVEQQQKHKSDKYTSISLVLEWAEDPGKIEFFPALHKDLKISDIFISQEGLQSLVSFKIETLKGVLPLPSSKFAALILPSGVSNGRQVYSVDIEL